MKIDTHTHVLLTKTSSFDWRDVELHFDIARAHGLHVVCLTEHLDAKDFNPLYNGIFYENKLEGHFLADGIIILANGLTIVSGAEVPLKDGGEVGLCASMDVINSLKKESGYYTLENLLKKLDKNGDEYSLIGNHLCHPKKWIKNIEKYVEFLDAIEILSKYRHLKKEYKELADSLGKPLVSGSDSHTWVQFGLSYTDVDIEKFTISDFKDAIRKEKFMVYMSELTETMIRISELFRENLKIKAMRG